jgi:hypothetical protein
MPEQTRMKRTYQQRVTSVIASVVGLFALGTTAAHAAGWSGWARCELDIRGPGYQNKETHTWLISNVTGNTTATRGQGTWSAAGGGSLDQGSPQSTSQHAEWAINGGPNGGGSFGVSLPGNGMVSIQRYSSQLGHTSGILGYVQQTISYHVRTPTMLNATQYEWAFPTVQGPAASQTIVGSSTGNPQGGWGPMRPSGSTMTESCQWSFANGSVPAAPPPVNPPPPPVALTPPERPWSGSIQCDITTTANGYLDQQTHSWTLRGALPTASSAGFAHRATWEVKGKGSSQQSVGKRSISANWGTNVREKAEVSMFIRASDDMLIISAWQAPRHVPGGVTGSQQETFGSAAQPAMPISLDAVEWLFPPIVTESGRTSVSGKSTQQVGGWVAPLQPAGAVVSSLCTWKLQRSTP